MSRPKVNSIRSRVAKELAENAMKYKRALLREVDALYRQSPGENTEERLNELIDKVSERFKIKGAAKELFSNEVKAAQAEIKEVWGDYFAGRVDPSTSHGSTSLTMTAGDYEKMRALYRVDFTTLKEEQQKIIIEEVRKTIGAGKGYNDLRAALGKRGMGAAHAETLANTSLAQFDNAVMHEYAAQAGIEEFRYDGPLNANTREFCKRLLREQKEGRIFTFDEILKEDNEQGLDVLTSCGGFNCVHAWSPVLK